MLAFLSLFTIANASILNILTRCFAASALELLRLQGFTNERPNDPNIAIVITDGYSKDKVATRLQVSVCYVKCNQSGDVVRVQIILSIPFVPTYLTLFYHWSVYHT